MAERLVCIPPDPAFGWWITGLVDGEGCFFASLSFRVKAAPNGKSYQCVNLFAGLQIWLRADDRLTLQKAQDYFGCGRIQKKKVSRRRREKWSKNAKPAYVLRIDKMDELVERVIPHFDEFPLQSKKAADYEVWKETIVFVNQHLRGRKGWLRKYPGQVGEVVSMCERLKEARVYKPVMAAGG